MRRDDGAYEEFVHARAPALMRTAVLLCNGDRLAAESLLSDALGRAYVRWRWLPDPSSREPYVRTQLVRLSTRPWRPPEPGVPPPPDDDTPTVGEVDVWTYLAGLSPRHRAVVVLRDHERLSAVQIAETIGCSAHVVGGVPLGPAGVRSALAAAVNEVAVSATLVPEAVDAGTAARRRRRGLVAGAGMVTAGIAALSLSVSGAGPGPTPEPPPVPPEPPRSGWDWARDLPWRETGLAFTLGGRLFTPVGEFDLGRRPVRLLAESPEAWLVESEHALLLVRADGRVRTVPRAVGQAGATFDPDGRLLALGSAVLEVDRPGHVVADLPAGAVRLSGWTERGLEYLDGQGHAWVWQPGDRAMRVASVGVEASRVTSVPMYLGSGADELVHADGQVYAAFIGPGTSPGNRGVVVVRCWPHPEGGFMSGTGCARVSDVLLPREGEEVILGVQSSRSGR